jgi:hypothetical protein
VIARVFLNICFPPLLHSSAKKGTPILGSYLFISCGKEERGEQGLNGSDVELSS